MQRIKITEIKSGGVAEGLGLKVDDVLDTFAGVELSRTELLLETLSKQAGRSNELIYYRDGQKLSTHVASTTLGVAVVEQDLGLLLARWESREQARRIKVTTASILEGYTITETLDVISAECVFGMNIFKDFFAAVTDVVGGRSLTTQKVLKDARRECLLGLREEAIELGANAVIGSDLKYSEFSGGGKAMLFVVATGTAVIVKINE